MRGRAQRRSPAHITHDGSWYGSDRQYLSSRPQDRKQAESEPDEEHQQLRHAGIKLDDRHVLVAVMILTAGMLVTIIRASEMRVRPVTLGALAVHMRALRRADIAMGIDVHMQAAQLQGDEAQTRGQHD